MVIFDLPAQSGEAGLRIASLGSCRVHNPIGVLGRAGALRQTALGLSSTHTAAETLQALDVVLGSRRIPDHLNPYLYGSDQRSSPEQLRHVLVGGVEVVLLEVSSDVVFQYEDIFLQQNFLAIGLVQASRGALLPWYRQVTSIGVADDACVEDALARLRDGGHRHDNQMAELLRGLRQGKQGVDDITHDLTAMMSKVNARWVVLGHFLVPGDQGAVMDDRRALNAKLGEAAARCGAVFHDPSELVARHGRAKALQGGGANIYEYDESFYPVVGEMLVDLAREAHGTKAPSMSARSPNARETLAIRINDALVALHRRRLDTLGVEGSGLYDHYRRLLERKVLVGDRDRTTLELIDAYLPPYEAYDVLRAGLGELPLLLAASGRRVFAHENNPHRRAAIAAGAECLEAAGLLAPGAVTLVDNEAAFDGRRLCIAGDFTLPSDEAANNFLSKLAPFDALLIDARLLLGIRDEPTERERLDAGLISAGFARRRLFPRGALAWIWRPDEEARTTCDRGQADRPAIEPGFHINAS